ncbi:MAG: SDR family oxidoreductase [Rhodospirillaceae bacterium]|nr:SDR family oxidoreductase [Rhodospirillaceae bacterium]
MTEPADTARQFAGKIAVVTGGTQGLGETTARLFARRGAAGLVLCGRQWEKGEAVARELSGSGVPTLFVKADLFKVEDCRKVIADADAQFGKIHVLVNAAAVTDRGTILDTSPERFDLIFHVNVRAPFFLMQDALKIMLREKIRGTIVNVASMSSHGGQPFITAYCASKGALVTLTKNVAYAVLRNRIRVNCLNLGWMATPGEDRIMKTYHGAQDGWLREAEARQPFGRLISPEEAARAIAFLASDESGLMTGSVVDFDQSVCGAYDAPPHPAAAVALAEAE